VLAKQNRVVNAVDFRGTMRTGRRITTDHAIVYIARRSEAEPSRFGFVVSKAVGNAVVRNLLRRRLRAIAQEQVVAGSRAADIVVRALPGSGDLSWVSLHDEIVGALAKGARR